MGAINSYNGNSALILLPPLIEQPRVFIDEECRYLCPSSHNSPTSASQSRSIAPRLVTSPFLVNRTNRGCGPSDAIDLPYLEVWNLDYVWPSIGRYGYRTIRSIHTISYRVLNCLSNLFLTKKASSLSSSEAGWARVHDCLLIEVRIVLDYLLCEGAQLG